MIVKRFLAIFYPPAEYSKCLVQMKAGVEDFFASTKVLSKKGYLCIYGKKEDENDDYSDTLSALQKGSLFHTSYSTKEGATTPPKRYTSGSIILAMENAGNRR